MAENESNPNPSSSPHEKPQAQPAGENAAPAVTDAGQLVDELPPLILRDTHASAEKSGFRMQHGELHEEGK